MNAHLPSDHDLLIRINENVKNLKRDVGAMATDVGDLKSQSATIMERLRGHHSRIAWLWAVVIAILTGGIGIVAAVVIKNAS